MAKFSNKHKSIFPIKRKRIEKNKVVSKETNSSLTQPKQQEKKRTTITESIKSGLGFGIGNAAVHSMVDTFSNTSNENIEQTKRNLHTQTTPLCESTIKNYNECLEIYGDKFHPVCLEIKKFIENLNCEKK